MDAKNLLPHEAVIFFHSTRLMAHYTYNMLMDKAWNMDVCPGNGVIQKKIKNRNFMLPEGKIYWNGSSRADDQRINIVESFLPRSIVLSRSYSNDFNSRL